jgi:hypothetical protein
MGILDRIEAELAPRPRAEWPVGKGAVQIADRFGGHDDDLFSPEVYGSYLATSNEVYSAVTLRARLMSSLTLKLYDREGADKREITSGPEYDLLRHVNPFWTRRRLAYMDECAMGLWGESVWAIEPGPAGAPSEIWWLKPSRVRPVPHETKYLAGLARRSRSRRKRSCGSGIRTRSTSSLRCRRWWPRGSPRTPAAR